ncbi:MAG TPA: gamma-glutamyl-gamma-aminobutyrate hydrolase family protein [Bauldia sp.]|nr:gamma-glutamyl-gamma-aminobutyrate hydrolase family protein [Bauldia sp.]
MTGSPLIVLPADVKEIDLYRWHAAAETYLRAVIAGFGGTPLVVPSLEGIDVEGLLERVDGVLVPGSRSNVHPSRYGAEADAKSEPYDTARDAASLPLIAAAIRKGVPLLAICRGMQELNVVFGGTLVSELQEHPGRDDHRAPASKVQDERFAIRQDAILAPEGELARVLAADRIRVNSLHRQGIGALAERLAVEATAPDGTIEAVRVIDAPGFAIGVQWHPEYWVESDEPSARLFAAFGRAARARMVSRSARLPAAAE